MLKDKGFWVMVAVVVAILVASYFDRRDAEDGAIDEQIRQIQFERMQPPSTPSKPYELPH